MKFSEFDHFELSERGEKVRRNLVAFSFLMIVLASFQTVPTSIPLLGISLDGQKDQLLTKIALISVQIYLLLSFVSCAGSSAVRWLSTVWHRGEDKPASMGKISTPHELADVLQKSHVLERLHVYVLLDQFMTLALPFILGCAGTICGVVLLLTFG